MSCEKKCAKFMGAIIGCPTVVDKAQSIPTLNGISLASGIPSLAFLLPRLARLRRNKNRNGYMIGPKIKVTAKANRANAKMRWIHK